MMVREGLFIVLGLYVKSIDWFLQRSNSGSTTDSNGPNVFCVCVCVSIIWNDCIVPRLLFQTVRLHLGSMHRIHLQLESKQHNVINMAHTFQSVFCLYRRNRI